MTRPSVAQVGAFLWVVASGLALASPAAAQEICAGCHGDIASAFAQTDHGRYFTADRAYQAATCSSCHAGADEHVASGAQTKPLNPSTGAAATANAVCLTCHENNPAQAHWQGSPHEQAGTKCAACHEVHGPLAGASQRVSKLPGADEITQTCLECHGGLRAALNARSTHPLRDGQMTCASCHNPHGTAGEKLLVQGAVNEVCYSCHQDARGPFLWEHAPVREDCLTCHRPHGSNYASLLQARTTQLCQSCHQQGRHQTVAGVPQSVWIGNKACLNCHSRIHGSNHPSGPLFQR